MSFLYGCCTPHERKKLTNTSDFEYVRKLIAKYNVIHTLLSELESEILQIMQQTLLFKNSNPQFYVDFKKFLITMFDICYKKCGLPINNELFND